MVNLREPARSSARRHTPHAAARTTCPGCFAVALPRPRSTAAQRPLGLDTSEHGGTIGAPSERGWVSRSTRGEHAVVAAPRLRLRPRPRLRLRLRPRPRPRPAPRARATGVRVRRRGRRRGARAWAQGRARAQARTQARAQALPRRQASPSRARAPDPLVAQVLRRVSDDLVFGVRARAGGLERCVRGERTRCRLPDGAMAAARGETRMRPDRMTTKSREAFQDAMDRASRFGNPELYPEHLLASMLDQEGGVAGPLLQKAGADL